MTNQKCVQLLISQYNVSWELAYEVAKANDFDYMMAAGDIRDIIKNETAKTEETTMKNTTPRVITLSSGPFDQVNTFNVKTERRTMTASLCRDYQAVGDGVYWAMSAGACLKSQYSESDLAESARLRSEATLCHGDEVLIDGELYRVRVLGAYSDCAIFDKVAK